MDPTLTKQLRGIEQQNNQQSLSTYWRQLDLARQRNGALAPKAANELVSLARAIGKSSTDIENDIALLLELDALKDAPAQLVRSKAECREHLQQAVAKNAESKRLYEQSMVLNREADGLRHRARIEQGAAQTAVDRLAELKRQLAAASHPDAMLEVLNLGHAQQVENLQNEVRTVDGELREITKEQLEGSSAQRYAQGLHRRRAVAVAHLQELGVEVPGEPPIPQGTAPATGIVPAPADRAPREKPLGGLGLLGDAPGSDGVTVFEDYEP